MKKVFSVLICILLLSNTFFVSANNISAKAAVVIDGHTGEILYSLNCDKRLPMASTTKIMTALLLCELVDDLSKTVVTTREMVTVEGSSMGLQAGDTVSYHDLLYGMLLASGNDAANTAAMAISGSIKDFVDVMNKRAAELGLKNTHFVTPSGLDADEHYTTAYELALIAKEALGNESFANAAASKTARLCYGNPPYNRTLKNHNKLLNMYEDIVGVKTGFTKKSGRCLVSAAQNDGKLVIAVTLNDGNDWQDHRTLLDLGFSLIKSQQFSPPLDNVNIEIASGEFATVALPSATLNITEGTKVTYKIDLPKIIYAPIKKGEQLGTINYYGNGNLLIKLPVNSEKTIKQGQNKAVLFFEIFKYMFFEI